MDNLKERTEHLRQALEEIKDVDEKSQVALSSLHRRLSTIGSDLRPIQEDNKAHENLSSSLSKLEDVVSQFDLVKEAEKVISEGPGEDLTRILAAMDELEQSAQFFNSHQTYASTESTLLRVKGLLADAAEMVETQFKEKLTALSKPVDPTSLFDGLETGTEQEMAVYNVPTFISPQDIRLLHNLVNRLVLGGHQTQCINIYRDTRANTLQQSLNNLGVENIQSKNTETEIRELIKLIRISVNSLFAGERNLCNQVLQGIEESSLDQCFVEVTSSSLARLLSFKDAVEKIEKSADNLFVLLDIYETMCRLKPEMEAMFASKASTVLQPMEDLRNWLGADASEIFLGFREKVVKSTPEPITDDGVHPISSYVMNYLKNLLNYQNTLTQLLIEYKPEGHQEEGLQFSTLILEILESLQGNMEEKSTYRRDKGRSCIFLMNNIQYMVTSVQETQAAKELLGIDWIEKKRRAVKLNADQYKKITWGKVLDTIPFTKDAKKDAVKKRFKEFNKTFEEEYQKQCLWKVHDSELRRELSLSVAEIVVPAYSSFMERCGPIVETSKSKCIQYTPEDINEKLLEYLFTG